MNNVQVVTVFDGRNDLAELDARLGFGQAMMLGDKV